MTNYVIACPRCIKKILNSQSAYLIASCNGHSCAQTVLLARVAGTENWHRIRDRTYQTNVATALSSYATSHPPQHCLYNDMICPFAHSDTEQHVWKLELDGKLNIFEMVTSRRQDLVGLNAFDNVGCYFMSKFGGRLRCICNICWTECAEGGHTCDGPESHDWNENKVLVHCSLQDFPESFRFDVLEIPSNSNESRQTVLCELLQDCPKKQTTCTKCHSFIERDFAFVRQHCARLTIEQLCQKLNNLKMTAAHQLAYKASLPGTKFPDFQLRVICKDCHQRGVIEFKNSGNEACARGHLWESNKGAAVLEVSTRKWIAVKPLPRRLPRDASELKICRHALKTGSCRFMNECQFAHCQLEKDVWTWQMTSEPTGLDF